MSVLLGAPVWYGNRPFGQTVKKLHELSLDYLEFSLDYPLPGSMKEADKEELKGLLADYGMRIAFHSPLDIAVMHPREEIADASMRILRQCMEFAVEFSPLYYNLHLHPRLSTYKLQEVRAEVKRKSIRRCLEIANMGSELGVQVCVENDLVPFEWSELILEAVSSPGIYLTFDIGHAIMAELQHSPPEVESEVEAGGHNYIDYLRRWIRACGGAKILVVHLHDCSIGDKQDHLSIGRGELDFSQIFKLLRATSLKYMVIETFWRDKARREMSYEELKRNIEFCRRYWYP